MRTCFNAKKAERLNLSINLESRQVGTNKLPYFKKAPSPPLVLSGLSCLTSVWGVLGEFLTEQAFNWSSGTDYKQQLKPLQNSRGLTQLRLSFSVLAPLAGVSQGVVLGPSASDHQGPLIKVLKVEVLPVDLLNQKPRGKNFEIIFNKYHSGDSNMLQFEKHWVLFLVECYPLS